MFFSSSPCLLNSAETQHSFTAGESNRGFTSFIPLTELRNRTVGYLANDTLVIKAEVCVFAVTPPVNIPPARPIDFDSCITGLKELINADETHGASVGSSSSNQDGALVDAIPSLEEVEKAKQSLRECLSDLFKLNMKARLSEVLSTLSLARTALSRGQQRAIETFQANFNDFTFNFLTFELQKLQKDQLFSAVKKCHETHIMYKQLMDDLADEEEELKRKMEEVGSKRARLLLDREILWVESEEAKSTYKDKRKKVAETVGKKRIAEERMSRSITALSNLKAQFCGNF